MTAQEELDEAFTEVGTQLKQRVNGLNGAKGLWIGTDAELPAEGSRLAGVVYVTYANP